MRTAVRRPPSVVQELNRARLCSSDAHRGGDRETTKNKDDFERAHVRTYASRREAAAASPGEQNERRPSAAAVHARTPAGALTVIPLDQLIPQGDASFPLHRSPAFRARYI